MEKELSELRKEVIEARNLVIKSDNQLKNLHAELKVVGRRHEETYRRTWFASAAAYFVFLVLSLTLSYFWSRASVAGERAQVEVARAESETHKKRVEELSREVASRSGDLESRRVAAQQALQAFKLMSEGEGEGRLKGVDEAGKLDRSKLSVLEQRALDDRARTLKSELAQSAYDRGRHAFRKEDMKTAATELRRYLTLDPDGSEAVAASFFLGAAYFQLKDFQGAAAQLEKFAATGKGQKNIDYGLFLLGESHEQTGNTTRAMEVYKLGIATYPGSEFLTQMQRRLRILAAGGNQGAPAARDGDRPDGAAPRPAAERPE